MLCNKIIEKPIFMQKMNNVTVTLGRESSLTFEFELPWPPKDLSPNARHHWAAAAKAKKAYRTRCRQVGEGSGLGMVPKAFQAVLVHLAFIPPDKRRRDWDNMVASMKSGLDGLADAMGVDDSRWRLSFDVSDDPVEGGRVLVSVEVVA
jgi:crossover junction endodeoxyribonuclease RusA